MADVIAFVPRASSAVSKPPADKPAEILFFTGVRYERQAEPAVETAREPRPGRGRRAQPRLRLPV